MDLTNSRLGEGRCHFNHGLEESDVRLTSSPDRFVHQLMCVLPSYFGGQRNHVGLCHHFSPMVKEVRPHSFGKNAKTLNDAPKGLNRRATQDRSEEHTSELQSLR